MYYYKSIPWMGMPVGCSGLEVLRMAKTFKIISKTLSTVIVVGMVLLAVLLAGVRLVGLTPYTVLSGSMEPNYHVGSVIYVMEVDPMELKDGDPVTYTMASGTVVTHRIIEVLDGDDPATRSFRTQGDANDTPDGKPVPASAVIGKPVFTIPFLGYVSDFVKRPQGLIVILCVCLLVPVLSLLKDAFAPEPKEEASADGQAQEPAEQPEET